MRITGLSLALIIFLWPYLLPAKTWDPRLNQSLELSFSGNPKAAEKILEPYLLEFPQDPNGLFVKAMVLEWRAGLSNEYKKIAYPKLRKIYKAANDLAFRRWEKSPEDVDRLIDFGNSYFLLARMHGKLGSKWQAGTTGKKARKHLIKAIQLKNDRWDAYLPLGAINYVAGNIPKGWRTIAKIFGIRGDKVEGLKQLKQSLKGNHPYLWNAHYGILSLSFKLGKNWRLALEQAQLLENRFPQNPVFPLRRAQILQLKDPDEAAYAFVEFIERCHRKDFHCNEKFLYLALRGLEKLSSNAKYEPY